MSPVDHPPLLLLAQAGQPLVIALDGLPGAGLLWQAPPAPAGCRLAVADSVPVGAGVGGPAQQRFVLTCDGPGEHQLCFELKRPWEAKVQAVQPVVVQVR